jgi:hypothetical protein
MNRSRHANLTERAAVAGKGEAMSVQTLGAASLGPSRPSLKAAVVMAIPLPATAAVVMAIPLPATAAVAMVIPLPATAAR